MGAQADRLISWIEHLDLGPVSLVGHDLGGGVVHIAAVRRPDLCAGLMIPNGIGYDSFTPEDHPDVIAVQIRSLAAEVAAR